MTFHPIDKPTEPGWYWCLEGDALWHLIRVVQRGWFSRGYSDVGPLEMIQVTNEGFEVRSKALPSHGPRDGFLSFQWYGPKIEPPAECAKSSGNSPSGQNGRLGEDVPRRFRWRKYGDNGFGLLVGGRMYLLNCPHGSCACWLLEDALQSSDEIEWLDPEPENPHDTWDELVSLLNDVTGGYGSLHRKQAAQAILDAIQTLREKFPLP